MPYDFHGPRPTRPRNWWSWERPKRSACSINISVAFGTSIPTSTTVIEVGIDVPNGTLMLIEHAERFGLSQLHQLRGRVGRGPWKSYGILLHAGKLTEDAERRIEAMTQTNDGFRIAETDLSLRGPGEFFGTRQSGLPQFRVADLLRDAAILEDARIEAQGIIATDPELK